MHPSATSVMQVEDLCFGYSKAHLFSNWSARICAGLTLLRGGEGSGKTTLLRLLAGQLHPTSGVLRIGHIQLDHQPALYRRQVFWADPSSDAFDQMTALSWLGSLRGQHPQFDQALLGDVIDGLSLGPHLEKPLFMLSTGSKRKVWLAGAFSSGAAVTLLDQPFAALDKLSIGFVLELLQDAADHPSRAWVVTHHEAPGDLPLAATIDLTPVE